MLFGRHAVIPFDHTILYGVMRGVVLFNSILYCSVDTRTFVTRGSMVTFTEAWRSVPTLLFMQTFDFSETWPGTLGIVLLSGLSFPTFVYILFSTTRFVNA